MKRALGLRLSFPGAKKNKTHKGIYGRAGKGSGVQKACRNRKGRKIQPEGEDRESLVS